MQTILLIIIFNFMTYDSHTLVDGQISNELYFY